MHLQRFCRAALLAGTAFLTAGPAAAQVAAAADPAVAPPPAAAEAAGKRIFTPADFARFAPRNALDMLRQVPGFMIRSADQERGLGQASENVLLNGQRVQSKSGGAVAELEKIPAGNVERIEIVDAATLGIGGLTGQVANVIGKENTGASGQFSWRPEFRPRFSDPAYTRGDISFSGSKGPVAYTIGLDGNSSRNGAGGPTLIFDSRNAPVEVRDEVWRSSSDNPTLSSRFSLDGPGSSLGNLTLAYEPNFYTGEEVSIRERLDEVGQTRSFRQRGRGFEYEVGGDYEFALGLGRLRLVGLRSFEHEPSTSTAIVDFADGSPAQGDRVVRDGRSSEWIGRSEYGWTAGAADWQLSAEAAFNSLENVTRIFLLESDGEFTEIDFPAGTGRVDEDRYEMLGTYGRPLTGNLSVQIVAGGEYSKLSSESSIGRLTRTFLRPKASLSLAWQQSDDFDLSLKFRRRVGQLDFDDFLASVSLSDGRENAGNLELVPPQSWEADVEANRKLGAWGTTSLRLFGRLIDDIVDIVPIGEDGQSPGNIDRAGRFGAQWQGTILFDPLGLGGAKLDAMVQVQRSRLDDPLTGISRAISGDLQRQVRLNFRHDIPFSRWAWGADLYHDRRALSFRLTEFGRMQDGPVWFGAFVENKDVAGMTVRAGAGNLLNARNRWDRTVYDGFRTTSPVLFTERRNRLIGPIFNLSMRGNF